MRAAESRIPFLRTRMGFLDEYAAETNAERWEPNLIDFAPRHVRPQARPFDWGGREYLADLYRDTARRIVVQKAAQLGVTAWSISTALHHALHGHHDVAYFLDTRERLQDMVQSVVHPTIQGSPDLQVAIRDPNQVLRRAQQGKRPADNLRLLRIGKANIYFRSMQKLAEAKSVPLDVAIIDEGSEVARAWDPDLGAALIDFIPDRLLNSTTARLIQISQPGLPGLDIAEAFDQSDGKEWIHTCLSCRHSQELTDTFPECIRGDKIVCIRCGTTFYQWADEEKFFFDRHCRREWVAARPGREISGYHMTQLWGRATPPAKLLDDWLAAQGNPSRERRFAISILGQPIGGDRQPISHADIEACLVDEPQLDSAERMSFAGVDTGEPHWFVAARREGDVIRLLDFGPEPDPAALIKRLQRLQAAVLVDANAERTLARTIVEGARTGAVCEFASVEEPRQREHEYLYEDRRRTVRVIKADREDSLDEVAAAIRAGRIAIPRRHPHLALLRRHLLNLVRDPAPRAGREKYRHGVENHLALCLCYLLLLIQQAPKMGISSGPLRDSLVVGGRRPQEW